MVDGRLALGLIINADDFGASDSVNDGVMRAHRDGVVTSASLMAGGAAFGDALGRLDELPALGIGVHLTLCAGPPVLAPEKAPTLVDVEGRLPGGAAAFAGRYFRGAIKLAEVRAELEAQLGRVRDAGVTITHVDSHQHVHNLPGVSDVVIALARRFGVRAVRASRCRVWPPGRGWFARQILLRINAEAFVAAARRAGLKTPDGLLGQGDVGRLTAASIRRDIAAVRGGVWELMCHPGTANEPGDDPAMERGAELAVLMDEELKEGLREEGVRLLNYAAL